MSGFGRLGGVYALLEAGHWIGDYWCQSGEQARAKGEPGGDGHRACATHVATLTATQAAFLAVGVLATGERLNPRRVAAGLAVNAISHYAMDRRDHGVLPKLTKALARWGKEDFARLGTPPLASGAHALDQSWHIGWCAVAAAIIAGRAQR